MKPKKKALKNIAFVAAGLFIASVVLGAGAGALGFLDGGQQADLSAMEEQVDHLRAEVEADPENVTALRNLGNAKMQVAIQMEQEGEEGAIEYYEKALENFESAVELDEDNPELLVDKATAAYTTQNTEKAEESIEKALELDPENVNALHISAFMMLNEGEYDEAIDKWDKILDKDQLAEQEREQFETLIAQAEQLKEIEEMDPKEDLDKEEWEEEFEEEYLDEKDNEKEVKKEDEDVDENNDEKEDN
ncbi:tetratricopeptide repeat protein [Natranaerobius thermophilus]|nr:tetratricopeptide repeat protein [Natranaerobius thermophilus]